MTPLNKMNNEYVLKRVKINQEQRQVPKNTNTKPQTPAFNDVLNRIKDNDKVKFSKHAMDRLSMRNIDLSDQELTRIQDGVGKAKNKGVKEALIMMDNKVFIASVKNNTIITAAIDEQLKENVFTNIDGAVIV